MELFLEVPKCLELRCFIVLGLYTENLTQKTATNKREEKFLATWLATSHGNHINFIDSYIYKLIKIYSIRTSNNIAKIEYMID